MALRSNAFVACPLHLSEHQEAKRCAEDGCAIDIEKDDAGAISKAFLSKVLVDICSFMHSNLYDFSSTIRNKGANCGKRGD